MADIIAAIVIIAILGAAIAYIVSQKRAGVKCIGCSVGQECAARAKAAQQASGECACSCSCGAVDQMIANMDAAAKQPQHG